MLVLARLRNQSLVIGHDITVTVTDIRGDKVRLGIAAPRNVSVHRKEIYDQIMEENRRAARLTPHDVSALGASPHPTGATARDPFLLAAVQEARRGVESGGLPDGAVLVRNNQIIGRGYNRCLQQNDPLAYAPIECLRNAARQPNYRDTILYTTLAPNGFCCAAAAELGIPRILIGDRVNYSGPAGANSDSSNPSLIDLHDQDCIELTGDFIKAHPDLWSENFGR